MMILRDGFRVYCSLHDRSLALGLDFILRGKIDSAADLTMQRFKSCSMHLRDGQWRFGHFLIRRSQLHAAAGLER